MQYIKKSLPFGLYEINILDAKDSELLKISSETSIGLSLDEMKRVKNYFQKLNRNPTDIELQALGQAWSEHCCYKSSKPILKDFVFGIYAPQNILVIKEDAGVVEFDEKHAYVVALESFPHSTTPPSATIKLSFRSTSTGCVP